MQSAGGIGWQARKSGGYGDIHEVKEAEVKDWQRMAVVVRVPPTTAPMRRSGSVERSTAAGQPQPSAAARYGVTRFAAPAAILRQRHTSIYLRRACYARRCALIPATSTARWYFREQ